MRIINCHDNKESNSKWIMQVIIFASFVTFCLFYYGDRIHRVLYRAKYCFYPGYMGNAFYWDFCNFRKGNQTFILINLLLMITFSSKSCILRD